ncbi:hypothetical protein ACFCVU_16200 [Peribacillus butanolivorans]|uniref:hypothetical protein n=1 Tax=Peribacillus butanolivorans TaxID=421767 RepID=UPI0035DADBE3
MTTKYAASKILGLSVIDLMKNEKLVKVAKEEFEKELEAKGNYRTPLLEGTNPRTTLVRNLSI